MVVVKLEPGYNKHYLDCGFIENSEVEKAKTLRIGQEVTIEGKLDKPSVTVSVRLTNSILLKW